MPLAVGAVVSGIGGIGKLVSGLSQNSNANKLKNSLVRPTYTISPEYYTNQNLAEQQAEGGLSEASKSFYGNQADRGLTAGINATLQGGGDINDIGGLYDKYTQGNAAIAAKDSELQNENIRYLIDRNKDVAGEETKAWALNKYEPYKDQAAAATAEKNAAQQNIWGGVSQIGSSITAAFTPPDPNQVTSDNAPNPNNVIPNLAAPTNTAPFVNRSPFPAAPVVSGSDLDMSAAAGAGSTLRTFQNSPYYDALQSYFLKT